MLLYTLRLINNILLGMVSKPIIKNRTVKIPFRCWPVDLDTYMHMNNANFFRVAELSRWRQFPSTGLMKHSFKRGGLMFLVVEQQIQYLKPILPFQKYTISTTITHSENKWLHYEHLFEECVPEGVQRDPVVYAKINLKAVMKERSGKTVRPSDVGDMSDYIRQMIAPPSEEEAVNNSK